MTTKTIELDEDGDLQIWMVQFSNYEPPEIDSLWLNEEDAKRRASELPSGWEARWTWVKGSSS